MRLPSEIHGTREERVAQFKNDAELMGVATKLVSEVIEKAKVEAMRRRKPGVVPQQVSVEGRGLPADDGPRSELGAAAAATAAGAQNVSAQRLKLALGNIKDRVSTAYGSLAERLRAGYRVNLMERPWSRGASERLRNPFSSRRGSGQGSQGQASLDGSANGDPLGPGLATQS